MYAEIHTNLIQYGCGAAFRSILSPAHFSVISVELLANVILTTGVHFSESVTELDITEPYCKELYISGDGINTC